MRSNRVRPVVADGELTLQQQRQAVFEVEAAHISHSHLLLHGFGHAAQAQFVEVIQGLLGHHSESPWDVRGDTTAAMQHLHHRARVARLQGPGASLMEIAGTAVGLWKIDGEENGTTCW
jgi:hypothetical protein